MDANWSVRGNRLCLSISYQKPNETSSGTSGCSANWQIPIKTLASTAQEIIADVKKDWNWRAIKGLDDWVKLI